MDKFFLKMDIPQLRNKKSPCLELKIGISIGEREYRL